MPETWSLLSLPPSSSSPMTFRPGSQAETAGAGFKTRQHCTSSKGFTQPLRETDRVGGWGLNSVNLCESGPVVELFIISRQHTWAWNIGLQRHWVLATGRKQGLRRCRGNANESPSICAEVSFTPLAQQNNSILASGLIASATASHPDQQPTDITH